MPTLYIGQQLTKDDLKIFIRDENGIYISPFSITYTILKQAPDFTERACLIDEPIKETINTIPIPFGIGKFFAAWTMPKDTTIGSYKIQWNIKRYSDSPIIQESQEFDIVVQTCISAEASSGGEMHLNFTGGPAG